MRRLLLFLVEDLIKPPSFRSLVFLSFSQRRNTHTPPMNSQLILGHQIHSNFLLLQRWGQVMLVTQLWLAICLLTVDCLKSCCRLSFLTVQQRASSQRDRRKGREKENVACSLIFICPEEWTQEERCYLFTCPLLSLPLGAVMKAQMNEKIQGLLLYCPPRESTKGVVLSLGGKE